MRHSTSKIALLSLFMYSLSACSFAATRKVEQLSFNTPEQAAVALRDAAAEGDLEGMRRILGPESKELLSSGDEVKDSAGREKFVELFDSAHHIERTDKKEARLHVGEIDWPFTIPLVQEDTLWFFDTEAGKEEVLNRQIGQNEFVTMRVLDEYAAAQREYAEKDRNGNGTLEYARKLKSTDGKTDGLYWPQEDNKEQSPLGPLVAYAQLTGYSEKDETESPSPFHGYYYKMLSCQGKHAAGGAKEFIEDNKMTGGFAAISAPARYGVSGVMSFIVGPNGQIYQADLGEETLKIAKKIPCFNPGPGWTRVANK